MSDEIGGIWRTVGGRRIFIKDGQDLSSAMIESGKFNKQNTKEKHPKPKLLGQLEDLSENGIENTLKNYEAHIKDDKIENAIVITKEGKIYQCFGNKTNVWPNIDLGEELIGAFVTHNHTKEATNYSFSEDDLNLFEKYKLSKLRGIDNKYTYELDRNKNPSLNNPTFEDSLEDSTFEHLRFIQYAIDNDISYMRWKND